MTQDSIQHTEHQATLAPVPTINVQMPAPTLELQQPHATLPPSHHPRIVHTPPRIELKPFNPDSMAGPMPLDSAWMQPDSLEVFLRSQKHVKTVPPAKWETGIEGDNRTVGVGDNSGVITIVAAMVLAMMLCFRNGKRMFGHLAHELWGMRSRGNAFDEHTSGEARMMVLMAMQWCVYGGLLVYSAVSLFGPGGPLPAQQALPNVAKLIGLMAVYYVFQLAVYNVLGYVFADSDGRRLLMKGFSASQSLLSFALIVPALVSIFYPAACMGAVMVGAVLYLIGRIVFVVKGFRIFYTNFGSLLYFILYLCALEIIPLVIVASAAVALVSYV